SIERDRGRFDQCTLLVTDTIRDPICIVIVDNGVLTHSAPLPTEADTPHARTKMIQSPPAEIIVERHHQRLDRNPVAGLESADAAAGFDDFGRELMPQNLRQ